MYCDFGLVLMITRACNLRCTYCYTGSKGFIRMTPAVARRAVDCALGSLEDRGTLNVGFFGGEPLLEPVLIREVMDYARGKAEPRGVRVRFQVTTNGTIDNGDAWRIMLDGDVELAVSCDGLPDIHDRHRRTATGEGSSWKVVRTLVGLLEAGKRFSVVMVVSPDTVEPLPNGIVYLRDLGVRLIEPSLNVWAPWTAEDIRRLEEAIERSAQVWLAGLPETSITWFDEKAAALLKQRIAHTSRCGFGDGEVAVAPSGRLYPCERLIGEDDGQHPLRIRGEVQGKGDFLGLKNGARPQREACSGCGLKVACNTFCRGINHIRTGDVNRPDGLLCAFNAACAEQTAQALKRRATPNDAFLFQRNEL